MAIQLFIYILQIHPGFIKNFCLLSDKRFSLSYFLRGKIELQDSGQRRAVELQEFRPQSTGKRAGRASLDFIGKLILPEKILTKIAIKSKNMGM